MYRSPKKPKLVKPWCMHIPKLCLQSSNPDQKQWSLGRKKGDKGAGV